MKKVLKWTGIVIGGLIGITVLAVLILSLSGMKKFSQSFPGVQVETVNIPSGADAVARGKHIAAIWGCVKCHGEDLSGMLLTNDPFLGTIPATNLTSGSGGVGKDYNDVDWVRAIRHGIKPDGRVEIFMYDYYSTLSDQDLGTLIAYLKQLPPVDSNYPAMHVGPVLAAAPAVGLYTPAAELIDHNALQSVDPAPEGTIEYGKYLSVLCAECHGTSLGSKLKNWKQEDFIHALQTGVLPDGKKISSAMSLKTYGEMDDTELAALWLYIKSITP